MHAEDTRSTLKYLRQQQPFEPFLICLENGDRYLIEHPENVAFDPSENGRTRFSVVTSDLFCYSNFESVSFLVHRDTGASVGS